MQAHPFRTAVEARHLGAMVEALAPDVVFHSPVRFKPFEGRDAVSAVLGVVLEVFEDFRYTDELSGPAALGLLFRARVGDRQVEGLDVLRHDEQGRISHLTVMVRPLSAVIALAEAVGERLGDREKGPVG